MKQPVRLYAWLTGLALLLSQSLMAQTDSSKPKSRLELGQKPTPTGRVIHSRNFPFLKHPTVASLDRGVTIQKNAAINQYYRNQLLNSANKTPARTTSAEAGNLASLENRPPTAEENRKNDNQIMYSNDQITVSNIYPNPANEFAEIDYQISGNVKDAKLTLYNVLGAQVADHTLDRNERKVRIITRDMNSGLYFYQLSLDGKKIVTKKLMVSHQ
ncbi:putative secreted protein (Por secretion system target) [Larkinella arboricola]|uniref:Putative secreted protein (Por secretion system target) n=1 Tax=Larkinella arboricola TaxID=643671 RepID=A0A327X0G3_LARAB|nr:T9SS type A sorting domain-containing protein [Larkinella arboricola]RAJ99817.1 putative secreted protein (Por secretion system target) [Larkinella arboricola]